MTNGNGKDPAAEADLAGAAGANMPSSVFEEEEEEFVIPPSEEEEEEIVATAPSPAAQSHDGGSDASGAPDPEEPDEASGPEGKKWTGVLGDGDDGGVIPEDDVDARLEALRSQVGGGTVVPIGGSGLKPEDAPGQEAATNGETPDDKPDDALDDESDGNDGVDVLGSTGEDDALAETGSADDPLEPSKEVSAKAASKRPALPLWQRIVVLSVGGSLVAVLGYWQLPFRSPASETRVAVASSPAPASPVEALPSYSPAATLAPETVEQEPAGALQERVERIAGDLDELNRNGGLLGPRGGVPAVEGMPVGPAPSGSGISPAQWEEVQGILERMEQRMAFIEQEQRNLADAAKAAFEMPRPVLEPTAPLGSEEKPRAAPLRARLADCEGDALVFVRQLGVVRMAAREGVDGRRWVRILADAWRSDVAAGDRLPVGGPGEARVWVDQAGVFGVVEMPGHGPCRVTWDDEETPK